MKRRKMLTAATLGAAVAGWLLWGNSALMTSEYAVTSPKLPAGFDGFRIAQVSDLHNAEFGKGNRNLLERLEKAEPHIIVLTGDIIDSRNTDIAVSLSFAAEAVKIAPCYYITGNHEARVDHLGFPEQLRSLGVTVLRNEAVTLQRNGDTITLLGVDDPTFVVDYMTGDCRPVMTAALEKLTEEERGYTILLSHRPEWFSLYRDFDLDLVFSGHAHGGQFRIPFVGGVIAPNQGFFPDYDAGVFTEGDTTMVVSRGLGPSIILLRINNRPELVVAELHREEN